MGLKPDTKDQVIKAIIEMDAAITKIIGKIHPLVVVDDNMTVEEKEMAYMEGFLKQGLSPDEAAAEAKKTLKRDMAVLQHLEFHGD